MKENLKTEYQILHIVDVKEISKILYDFNHVFKMSLSERIYSLESYAEKLKKNAIVFVAKKNDILGFIAFYANDNNYHTAYLTLIAVQPFAQNRKIGKNLLDVCIETSRSKGMKAIKLEVHNDNIKAMDFYKRNGFKFYGKASANSMYMIKNLK